MKSILLMNTSPLVCVTRPVAPFLPMLPLLLLSFIGPAPASALPGENASTTQISMKCFAGALDGGTTDGTGISARFDFPYALAVDEAGNVYVADSNNQTIRKITSGGAVSTFAGTAGSFGASDGKGGAARFSSPQGVAVAGSGIVYVTDTNNQTVRKITPDGMVETFAGSPGATGSADGLGSAAQFDLPSGVAVDGAGNVYVADSNNQTIRKITPAGVVTTLAGSAGIHGAVDGIGGAARFSGPQGVVVDGAGNIYVADTNNQTIRKISYSGEVTTLAGAAGLVGSNDGTGSSARFNYHFNLAVDKSGNVYVADVWNHTIRKVTSAGVVTTLVGTAGLLGSSDGTGGAARFSGPRAIAVDSAGNIYVADTGNNTIRKGLAEIVAVVVPGGLVLSVTVE